MPLIAETGGINAMIVDATALPEQVVDDVVVSAFRSAGQRCSALRLTLPAGRCRRHASSTCSPARPPNLKSATRAMRDTHVGPVIDIDAKEKLEGWIGAHA